MVDTLPTTTRHPLTRASNILHCYVDTNNPITCALVRLWCWQINNVHSLLECLPPASVQLKCNQLGCGLRTRVVVARLPCIHTYDVSWLASICQPACMLQTATQSHLVLLLDRAAAWAARHPRGAATTVGATREACLGVGPGSAGACIEAGACGIHVVTVHARRRVRSLCRLLVEGNLEGTSCQMNALELANVHTTC
jgi:hypothetical protein